MMEKALKNEKTYEQLSRCQNNKYKETYWMTFRLHLFGTIILLFVRKEKREKIVIVIQKTK